MMLRIAQLVSLCRHGKPRAGLCINGLRGGIIWGLYGDNGKENGNYYVIGLS